MTGGFQEIETFGSKPQWDRARHLTRGDTSRRWGCGSDDKIPDGVDRASTVAHRHYGILDSYKKIPDGPAQGTVARGSHIHSVFVSARVQWQQRIQFRDNYIHHAYFRFKPGPFFPEGEWNFSQLWVHGESHDRQSDRSCHLMAARAAFRISVSRCICVKLRRNDEFVAVCPTGELDPCFTRDRPESEDHHIHQRDS